MSNSGTREGTAAQLNAQLFEALGANDLFDLEIGANYIAERIDNITMELVILNSTQQPETVKVFWPICSAFQIDLKFKIIQYDVVTFKSCTHSKNGDYPNIKSERRTTGKSGRPISSVPLV